MPLRPPLHRAPGQLSPEAERTRWQREADARRGGRKERGYDTAWERFRLMRLAEEPLCQAFDPREQEAGRSPYCMRSATEVHHIKRIRDRPDLRLSKANTACLCKPHHSAITALEDVAGRQSLIRFVSIAERKL